jgi:NRAMP (natural resistance-associated macrophage protein) metal ion transporters
MDPGNWVTSIGGGSQFGYMLLSVILLSSLVAMLLQYMAAKLGIVTGLDLAQATRAHTGRRLGIVLWVVAELAIMATDIAEVIGAAIALHLLFGMSLVVGVLLTVFDVFVLLLLMQIGFRKIEAIVATLIVTIMVVFVYEVWIASPDLGQVALGFIPTPQILQPSELHMALGIVGATVMPHNLYLHSAIVQSRAYDRADEKEKARAVRFATWDSNLQLSAAFVINCLLLLLGAALFFGTESDLSTFGSLYAALQDNAIAGAVASPVLSTLFAVALLASGQNSTITGTLTGQVVMEGFIRLRVPLWFRRVITRLIAVIPVVICTIIYGGDEAALDALLVNSQVFLCIALPVSMVPLVWFTSSKKIMGERFANARIVSVLGWVSTAVLTVLNLRLIGEIVGIMG